MVRSRQQASKARGSRAPRVLNDAPTPAAGASGPMTSPEVSPAARGSGGGVTPARKPRGAPMPTSMQQVP